MRHAFADFRRAVQHARRVRSPETGITACANDFAGARARRLRNDELNDWSASDETFAPKFAEYLASDGSRAGASWGNCPDCRQCYLPSASRDSEGICFYQP